MNKSIKGSVNLYLNRKGKSLAILQCHPYYPTESLKIPLSIEYGDFVKMNWEEFEINGFEIVEKMFDRYWNEEVRGQENGPSSITGRMTKDERKRFISQHFLIFLSRCAPDGRIIIDLAGRRQARINLPPNPTAIEFADAIRRLVRTPSSIDESEEWDQGS